MADNSKDDFGTDLNSVEVPVEIPVDLGLPEFGSEIALFPFMILAIVRLST